MTETDDAQGSSLDSVDAPAIRVQLGRVATPFAVAHVLVHAHELARNRDQETDRLLGDFNRITPRGVADDQAMICRGFAIHAIDADPGAADHLAAFELGN